MKKYIILAIILVLFTASQVVAETLNLKTLPVTTAKASDGHTYYVGAVGGYLTGSTSANFFCDDFASVAYVPSSFNVLVSSVLDISGTKFANQQNALTKYQQVGWLMNQMEINPAKIAAIQFAMWSVFTPSAPTFEDSAAWLDASTKISASSYDFSQMRIYTAASSGTQEFIGGRVTAVPEPAEWMLLIMGLIIMSSVVYRKRHRAAIHIRT